jgi:hypothetical protein
MPESETPGSSNFSESAAASGNASLQDWIEAASVLIKWQRRARESQYAHYEAAKALESANYSLGIPVTILSTLVGTTIYAALQKQTGIRVQVIIGSISIFAAILAGVQTFLRFGERAEKHRSTAAVYGEVRRSLEVTTRYPLQFRPPLGAYLSQVEKKLNDLARTAPNVSDRIFARGLRKMKEASERHALDDSSQEEAAIEAVGVVGPAA